MTSDLKKMYSNFCRRVLKVVGKIGPSADAADALKRFSSAVNNPIFHFSEKRSRNISRCPPPNRDMETRCPPGGDTPDDYSIRNTIHIFSKLVLFKILPNIYGF